MSKSGKEEKPAKSKGKLGLILGAVGLLAVGGGGMFGLVQAGVIGGGHHEAKQDNNPKLIRKGEVDPYAPVSGKKEEGGAAEVDGEGGDEYRTAYYTFSEEFTSNLKNSDAMVQMALACSTRRDGRVLMWLKKHELAIRSQLLTIIADTPEENVYTMAGKEQLQKRMTAAINKVLTQKEGFGGVDAVYFRSFIVQ
ncbi:flagellar basal body-associated FliL family protein [Novosphingobium pentaromativorans]|uniref:Flagellar protein FliL n=1 Tax=Novosphingobium pentaromativorans US6-1 TaxID=1088721 RepID=G6EAK7_9SPHN|nr:flagellar basal body-associated FliL family protein [Novosphingobium pentaromativorans]AIT80640.1 flagellar basal body-associated protein FliL [Novosphingobium pentaromativorans US6-1]EHJ61644.1 flagellar FliL protein [Novosphingobium pentaromativorans US6-1]